MKRKRVSILLTLGMMAAGVVSCTMGTPEPRTETLPGSNSYAGSESCRACHTSEYNGWKESLHSRMAQDARKNPDAIIPAINEERIRKDLAKREEKLKVPSDKIHVPRREEIRYTLGSHWKQRYVVEKDGTLVITPIQYNMEANQWVNYHEQDWDKRSWLRKCGGCHATGVNLEKGTFSEPGVSCESCHGKGSTHAALPHSDLTGKRQTITNPARLSRTASAELCGSCHNRGKATQAIGAGWPVGYEPGNSIGPYYASTSHASGDSKHVYANEYAKGHHQQYLDWSKSEHARAGVTCTSCHSPHETETKSPATAPGNCRKCHAKAPETQIHDSHATTNCTACHMPKIARSAEPGDIRSHVVEPLLPSDTLTKQKIPNSCQGCHANNPAGLLK